jgi:hypothetical protein
MQQLQQIVSHPERQKMEQKITETRICVAGEFFVKDAGMDLLPHPSSVDNKSSEAKVRYQIYLAGAEWDAYPTRTLKSLTGRMKFDSATIELPDRLNYLVESADGDGVTLRGMMKQTASEVMQLKWQCLVVDYQGLSDVPLQDISLADVRQLKPRSTIKAYSRENVINWHYERINGTMQLVYIMLREVGYAFEPWTANRTMIESYLVLALDENGNYYQQKITKAVNSSLSTGPREYVTIKGAPLKWLPVIFPSDEELQAGKLPMELGFLSPICDLALARYRMSAEYKETIRNLPPTTYTKGWTANDHDTFKQINNGRDFIITGSGSVNNLPGDVTVEIVGVDAQVQSYVEYFERNTTQARQLGAVIPDASDVQKTATEVASTQSEQNAVLLNVAESIESCYTRAILYCGMFEGLWSPDAIEQNAEQILIELHKEYTASKLTVEEVRVIMELVLSGLKTKEQAIRELEAGGWSKEDAETTLDAIDSGEDLTPED